MQQSGAFSGQQRLAERTCRGYDGGEFTQRLAVLADSYLEHILIIIRVKDRGACLRDFLDPWWSFTKGEPFVKRNANPSQRTLNNPCGCIGHKGRRLLQLDFVSRGAYEAVDRGLCKDKHDRSGSDRLIVNHAVPLARISIELFDRDDWTNATLRSFLAANYKRGLLTREEDALLNEAREGVSLNSRMPDGWALGDDPFARYRERGIAAKAEGEP